MTSGSFQTIIDDPANLKDPETVVLCSGKIYYELVARRQDLESQHTAIIRLEQFYPFPAVRLKEVTDKYHRAKTWFWVQEEPQNMGGWQFVRPRLEALTEKPFTYIGRKAASSPATGFPAIYKQEQATITAQAIGPPAGEKEQAAVS